jgi:hypothetical protein
VAKSLAYKAQVVVAHDAEKHRDSKYKYNLMKLRDNYKYACKYSLYMNATKKSDYCSTYILSNFIELEFLSKIFGKIKTDFGSVSCDTGL